MAQTFDLPVDVPWNPIAASPDMMDVKFRDDTGYPPAWQSSLAIYGYEPSPDDLPSELCNQKITYLKVTCSITGYQPTADETAFFAPPLYPNPPPFGLSFPDAPGGAIQDAANVFGDFTDAYFGCHGVLLNVAVFPSTTTVLQTGSTSQEFSFAEIGGSPTTLPNPYSDTMLTFSLGRGANLSLKSAPQRGPLSLTIDNNTLQIDLPVATNVVLQMAIPKGIANVTVSAYQRGTVVVPASNIEPTNGVQDVPIATSSPITQIVIQNPNDACGQSNDASRP